MPKLVRRILPLLLALMMAWPALGLAQPVEAPGFKVVETARFELVSADVTVYEHEKTGALVMVLENQDTNRTFNISFRTPAENDKGIPHIFEHATVSGSKKYPSKNLLFNLIHQTYNTYLNAMTTNVMTTYPMASLSEDQLLRYADYYTDSVFNPLLMEDESIFREEAWRYAMGTKYEPLTLAGTVYTEMQGSYTIQAAAQINFRKALYPGSLAGNSYGGIPEHILEMTWDDLKNYHDAYYHPSNSLTTMYGKLEQVPAFLSLLDGYFSAYDKKEFKQEDSGYTPLTAPVELVVDFPMERGTDTNNRAEVYYGFACPDATFEDEQAMDLLTTLLSEQSSVFQQEMKEQLPQASAACYYDNTMPDTAVIFVAHGLNPDQAQTFKNIVDQSLQHVRENGFDKGAVEAVAAATRLSLLLTTENANVGPDLLPTIAYFWAATGDTGAYSDYVDTSAHYMAFNEEGRYGELIEKYLTDNPMTALVTTVPAPGQKEENDSALKQKLAGIKDKMGAEEIDAIIQETRLAGEEGPDDSSQYVAQLQAVTVDSLPVERRIYEMDDQVGDDGVRRLRVPADVNGVGQVLLMLDAGALPQEDIHWFKLYTDLLGKLDTTQQGNADLSAQMTRYLYGREMRVSALSGASGQDLNPKLRVNFIAMDEDLEAAYQLVYEVLFENDLQANKVLDVVKQVKNSLKSTINNNAHNILAYRALSTANRGFAYFNYANFLDYYTFLEQVEAQLESEPQKALDRLAFVQEHLRNSRGLIAGFAGNAGSQAANDTALEGFTGKLNNENREAAVYTFPEIPQAEALVVDSAVQYNLIFATYEELGLSGYTGDLDALSALVSDLYLYPLLRDQYGAYSIIHTAQKDGIYILSYRDPNITETFDVYASLGGKLAGEDITKEELEGYILSAYSVYAMSTGELAGALSAMVGQADGQDQREALTWMQQLKAITPEQVKGYAAMYNHLAEKGLRMTAGGAAKIKEYAALYQQVLNPLRVEETDGKGFSDVTQGDWYSPAVNFAVSNGLLTPQGASEFGAMESATLGEFALALFQLVGGSGTQEEALAELAGGRALLTGFTADTVLTRDLAARNLAVFLPAVGVDISGAAPLPEAADADQISKDAEPAYRFLIENQMLRLTEDGAANPGGAYTRADLAQLLYKLTGN